MSGRDGSVGPVSPVGGVPRTGSSSDRWRRRDADPDSDSPAQRPDTGFDEILSGGAEPLPIERHVDPLAALEQLTELHLREKGFRVAAAQRSRLVEPSLLDFLS